MEIVLIPLFFLWLFDSYSLDGAIAGFLWRIVKFVFRVIFIILLLFLKNVPIVKDIYAKIPDLFESVVTKIRDKITIPIYQLGKKFYQFIEDHI